MLNDQNRERKGEERERERKKSGEDQITDNKIQWVRRLFCQLLPLVTHISFVPVAIETNASYTPARDVAWLTETSTGHLFVEHLCRDAAIKLHLPVY